MAAVVAVALELLLATPAPAEAYIGPGAGFVLVPSLLGLLAAAAAALLWPLRLTWRLIRGKSGGASARAEH